ncbi:MAG: cupredoxin domain-containing protein [Acidimicrobiia bacterium]|nr:cupredoxin domain-containing protein [Acidimicrobiia bacterium]
MTTRLTPPGISVLSTIAAIALVLAGCGGGDDGGGNGGDPARTIAVSATEYQFIAEAGIEIAAGETIEFEVTNDGEVTHEMQVLTSDAKTLGQTPEIPPSQQATVTVTFEEAGVFQVICDIDDHLSRGQRAQFEVTDA